MKKRWNMLYNIYFVMRRTSVLSLVGGTRIETAVTLAIHSVAN